MRSARAGKKSASGHHRATARRSRLSGRRRFLRDLTLIRPARSSESASETETEKPPSMDDDIGGWKVGAFLVVIGLGAWRIVKSDMDRIGGVEVYKVGHGQNPARTRRV